MLYSSGALLFLKQSNIVKNILVAVCCMAARYFKILAAREKKKRNSIYQNGSLKYHSNSPLAGIPSCNEINVHFNLKNYPNHHGA